MFKRQNRDEITGKQDNVMEYSEKFLGGCEELGRNVKYVCVSANTLRTHIVSW